MNSSSSTCGEWVCVEGVIILWYIMVGVVARFTEVVVMVLSLDFISKGYLPLETDFLKHISH